MSDGVGKEQEVSHDDPAEDKVTEARTEELSPRLVARLSQTQKRPRLSKAKSRRSLPCSEHRKR